jgi:hypothetical protein
MWYRATRRHTTESSTRTHTIYDLAENSFKCALHCLQRRLIHLPPRHPPLTLAPSLFNIYCCQGLYWRQLMMTT